MLDNLENKLSGKQRSLLVFVVLHLSLVVAGASSVYWFDKFGWLGQGLGLYSLLSGANSGYGFFSPGVDSQLRARFEVIDESGNLKEVLLVENHNRESELKVGNIITQFWQTNTDTKLRRVLSASWAGKVFARHPEAREVVVYVERYNLVSSEEYRSGKRPAWTLVYRGKFRANRKES